MIFFEEFFLLKKVALLQGIAHCAMIPPLENILDHNCANTDKILISTSIVSNAPKYIGLTRVHDCPYWSLHHPQETRGCALQFGFSLTAAEIL